MTPIILLYVCLPLWLLALWMWTKNFSKVGKSLLLWLASFFCIFVPMLFFPLCAYLDKSSAKSRGEDSILARREFKLRMWICGCSYLSYLIICFAMKHMGIKLYAELAVCCVHVFLFLLIITCWNLFKDIRE